MSRIIIALLFFTALSWSCQTFAPQEFPPAFVQIDSLSVSNEGLPSDIIDVWALEGILPLGTFEVPAKIPVLSEGKQRLIFRAGIAIDGIRSTRTPYPFLLDIDTTIDLKRGHFTTFKPNFRLSDAILRPFPLQELFETAVFVLQPRNATLTRQEENGNGYGKLDIEAGQAGEVIAIDGLILPQNEQPIYLEMNYQCSIDFIVGLQFTYNGQIGEWYELRLLPTNSTWRKVYVNLTQEANAAPQGSSNFKVFLRSRTSDKKETILLDNIRLLRFR